VATRVSASSKLQAKDAAALLEQVDRVYVSKGKKLAQHDLTASADARKTVLPLLLGPTGNLRAPTLRAGRTLLVGFNRDVYEQVLD